MDTLLSHGAEGADVAKLTALARAAGIEVPQYTDTEALAPEVVDAILSNLTLADRDTRYAEAGTPYKGRVIDEPAWEALRDKAAQLTGLTLPAAAAPDAGSAAAATGGEAAGGTEFPPAPPAGGSEQVV